jgi:hypothetical protein
MTKPGFVITAIACALAGACSNDSVRPGNALPLQEVLSIQNAMTGIETPTRTLIATPETWATTWAKIFASYAPTQRPPLPAIDFTSRVVVLAAAGVRGAQGFFFTIEEVRSLDGTLQVIVLERWPSCGTLPALSAPVHAVSVPRVATTAEFTLTKQGPPTCN